MDIKLPLSHCPSQKQNVFFSEVKEDREGTEEEGGTEVKTGMFQVLSIRCDIGMSSGYSL